MEKHSKILIALAGFAVVCIILTCGCTTQSATTENTGSAVVSSSNEEMADDTPVKNTIATGSVPADGMPPGETPEMDSEQVLEILQTLKENGIDTTEAEAALEDGDMDAVMAFLEENRPADGGPGDRPDGLPPQQ